MKKKLFSMLLVLLALCGMASAAVDMYITDSAGNSKVLLALSDTIELYIWYTGDDIIYFDYIIAATGPGTLSATVGWYYDFDPPTPNPNILATGRNPEYDVVALGKTSYEPPVLIPNSYEMMGAADDGRLEPGLAYPLAYVTLHCNGVSPPDVVITLTDIATYNTSWYQVFPIMHGMTIHQIPEPATIALLCLGGLLLRKK